MSVSLCALKWLHSFIPGLNDSNDPLNEKFLSRITNSVQRNSIKLKNRKQPLTKNMIIDMVSELPEHSSLTELRDTLIPVFAYSLLLRHDEITHINCMHIESVQEGLKILIPSSKTDVMRGGQFVYLSKSNSLVFDLFSKYLAKSGMSIGDNRFLFPSLVYDMRSKQVKISDKILSYDQYRSIIKKMTESLGLDSSLFGTHSCRSGGASVLASNLSEYELMLNGRWRDSRSIGSYIEISDEKRFDMNSSLNLHI